MFKDMVPVNVRWHVSYLQGRLGLDIQLGEAPLWKTLGFAPQTAANQTRATHITESP